MNLTTCLTTIALMAALFLGACRKDNAYQGEISVLKNGAPWEAKIQAQSTSFASGKAQIFIETFDKEGVLLETLFFYKVPTQIGKHVLTITTNSPPDDSLVGCFYTNGYKDELFDIYEIMPGDLTSNIEITSYDAASKELRGKFDLILWPVIPGSWNAPDSLVFSEGVFRTRLED